MKLEGPFAVGKVSRGYITWPGYEHLKWQAVVKERVPEARRTEAFRMNDGGWTQQVKNLEEYVLATS